MSKSKKMRKLIKAAKSGKPYAMYRLGICYELGSERPQDMNEAAQWIAEAAQLGYAPAVEWIKDYSFDEFYNWYDYFVETESYCNVYKFY